MKTPDFVLASASPARRKLLENAGIKPIVCPSNFDESQITMTEPQSLVQILAECKAKNVASQFKEALILACDSMLVVDKGIYGKPESPQDAIAVWQKMRGNSGILYTGHVFIDRLKQRQLTYCGITKLEFADLDDRTIEAYVATGEPLQCAGCFALEGRGGLFVNRIEGCHSNVIGLSLPILREAIAELGYQISDFW